jgi:hypothetical protein
MPVARAPWVGRCGSAHPPKYPADEQVTTHPKILVIMN